MLAGMSLLTEMGFGVSFGIALGAFVVSMFLTCAIGNIWQVGMVAKQRLSG